MDESRSKGVVISEILFIILPLIIIVIYLFIQKSTISIFYKSDWTFASIVLFGQSIIKFTSGLIKSNMKFHWQKVALILSFLIVIGLIPATIVLILILGSPSISLRLVVLQMVVFIVSVLVYFFIGSTGQLYLDKEE